ncbi:MAG: thioredoxin-dependent thiol peroxidase [Bacteroidota bacterium]
MLKAGDKAPSFTLPSSDGSEVSLSDFKGKKVVLYFYPKDDTPGCTTEACSFRDDLSAFKRKGAVVLGVSVDGIESHQKFAEKYSLSFPLLSDEGKKVVKAYGVWKEKNLYGRKYMGTERTTFLIDKEGKIAHVFPKVKVDEHAKDVLDKL